MEDAVAVWCMEQGGDDSAWRYSPWFIGLVTGGATCFFAMMDSSSPISKSFHSSPYNSFFCFYRPLV